MHILKIESHVSVIIRLIKIHVCMYSRRMYVTLRGICIYATYVCGFAEVVRGMYVPYICG